MTAPELMTVREACEYLRISRSSVYRAVGAGELPVVKLGRSTRFTLPHLEAFVNAHTAACVISRGRQLERTAAAVAGRRIFNDRFGERR